MKYENRVQWLYTIILKVLDRIIIGHTLNEEFTEENIEQQKITANKYLGYMKRLFVIYLTLTTLAKFI